MIIAGLGNRSILLYCQGRAVVIGDNYKVMPPLDKIDVLPYCKKDEYVVQFNCKDFDKVIITSRYIRVGDSSIPIDVLESYIYPQLIIAGINGVLWSCRLNVNMHIMHVEPIWLESIVKGIKVVEGRIYDEKRRRILPGDCIILRSNDNNAETYVYVKYIHLYNDFGEMLEAEGLNRVLPGIKSINEGLNIYYKYYDRGMEKQYGVVAIGLGLL